MKELMETMRVELASIGAERQDVKESSWSNRRTINSDNTEIRMDDRLRRFEDSEV